MDWWKSPVLQGEDNDYGQYDYMIEELPKDYVKWVLSRYKWKCDDCGKESHLLLRSAHYFYTLDGWDSMDYSECWRCRVKGMVFNAKWKIKKCIKCHMDSLKDAVIFYKASNKQKSFKYYYQLAVKLHK